MRRLALLMAGALGCGSPTGEPDLRPDGSSGAGEPSSGTSTGSGATSNEATGASTTATGGEFPEGSTGGEPVAIDPDAGYVSLEPVAYSLGGTSYESSAARMFYAFQPADEHGNEAPLFLFFSGGPGAGTGILHGFNTAPTTLDPQVVGDTPIADNPVSWTRMGHCLWIDSRLAGFSYGVMDDPSDAGARAAEFSVANFNPFVDAADFIRTLLAFYESHPALRDNPVVLVGASYGGVRATAILDLMLHHDGHADGSSVYQDPGLVAAIETHAVEALGSDDLDTIAGQFGHQVLIQPLLAGEDQIAYTGELLSDPGSPLFALGEELGSPFSPAFGSGMAKRQHTLDWVRGLGRDASNIRQSGSWTDDVITGVNTRLRTREILEEHLDLDPTTIPELFADARQGAYRVSGSAPSYATDLPATFGELQPWDVYMMSFMSDVFDAFYGSGAYGHGVEPTSRLFARLALRNLLHVQTFVTHGTADIVVWSPAIAPAFATHPEVEWSIADGDRILVQFVQGAFGSTGAAPYRELTLRPYDNGAHSLTATHPAEVFEDVQSWLAP